jgi:hypothetical protein
MSTEHRVTVVVATRNRRRELLDALGRLASLPERPALVVVDNGSSDHTAGAARSNYPDARVLELGRNLGAGARTEGARLASTPYVAFSDDDSWWQWGALARAAEVLDAYPRLALVAARIVVGPQRDDDPACAVMAASPLAREGLPGPAVMGFLACGAVVRRSAFLEVGGFDGRLGIGGEETLLALDLAGAGWRLASTTSSPSTIRRGGSIQARDDGSRRETRRGRRGCDDRRRASRPSRRGSRDAVSATTRCAPDYATRSATAAGPGVSGGPSAQTSRPRCAPSRRPCRLNRLVEAESAKKTVDTSGNVSGTSDALLVDSEL